MIRVGRCVVDNFKKYHIKKNFLICSIVLALLFTVSCERNIPSYTIDLEKDWRFSPDPQKSGMSEQWYSPEYDDSDWAVIDAGKRWEDQGYPELDDLGWYRKEVDIPKELKGRDLWIKFAGVNDYFELFINGKSTGLFGKSYYSVAGRPTAAKISDMLVYGETNLVTVKVSDIAGSGGIWKSPVIITTINVEQSVNRKFTFEKEYLNLPVKKGAPMCTVKLFVDNVIEREFFIELASGEPDFWVYMEIDEFKGKKGEIKIFELDPDRKDLVDTIYQDNTFPGEDELYHEKYRPQFHFSSKRGWLNDPNGLVYYDGEYHLFYQHNAFGVAEGSKSWGHAVSKDLLHWQELGDALYPDEWGTMWSGSAVVDWNNTTGFQTGDEPPLVAIYTNAGGENQWSAGKPFTQGLAFSNDHGRTWTKYEGNPVQGHINAGNRDPKVIWLEKTQEWVIVLYLVDGRMAFFTSPDLKQWELESILESFHECPELFQLPVDGNENNKKWILYGGTGDYFIGDFDGAKFTIKSEKKRYSYGDAFYASQTFSDIPKEDGRRIQIGWARIDLPGMPFNQMMHFPVELTLRSTKHGIRIFTNPVREIEKLYKEKHHIQDFKLAPESNPLSHIKGELFDISAEFAVGNASKIGFEIRGVPVEYDVRKGVLSVKSQSVQFKPQNGKIKLRLLIDRTSLEIFVNDGEYYMPMGSIPDDNNKSLNVFAIGGTANIINLDVNEINSAWN